MISTVTTTTTTTAATTTSTVTTVAGASQVSQLGLIAVVSLIILLIVKELSGAYSVQMRESGAVAMPVSRLDRILNTGIIPLLFAFGIIVAVKVIQIIMK